MNLGAEFSDMEKKLFCRFYITYDAHNDYQDSNLVKNRLYWAEYYNGNSQGEIELTKSQNFIDDVKIIVHLIYCKYPKNKNLIQIFYKNNQDKLGLAQCKFNYDKNTKELSIGRCVQTFTDALG